MDRAPSDWHEDFFDGLWLEVQAQTFDATQTHELVDAAYEALQLGTGARVLDVPAGDGRVAMELASRGQSVVAVERNAALLARGREQTTARGLEIDWREGDMWTLDAEGPFDGALCLWASIGYGTEEQDATFFATVAKALKPGAGLLIETHVVETLLPSFEPHEMRWAGNVAVAETRDFDPESGRIESEWIFSADDTREHKRSSLRLYTYRELIARLRTAGFDTFEAYASTDLEPFHFEAARLLLVARRGDESKE